MFDNKLFNVNGRGVATLAKTLQLALYQEFGDDKAYGGGNRTFTGFKFNPTAGIILTLIQAPDQSKYNIFTTPLNCEDTAEFVHHWLQSDDAKSVPLGKWEHNIDHDGHNTIGWRAYLGDWGNVDDWMGFIAVKRIYLWHGK
jgi:hypothetical protein